MGQTLRQYIDILPRPLAKSLGEVINATDLREMALYKFLQAYTRYGALVDLAQYAHLASSGRKDPQFEASLAGWAKPSFGKWLEYARVANDCIRRLQATPILPDFSAERKEDPIVRFTNHVMGKASTKSSIDKFLGAVVKWRNADQHHDAIIHDHDGCSILMEALPLLLDLSPLLSQHVPIRVKGFRKLQGRFYIKYFNLVGTSDLLQDEVTLEGGAEIPDEDRLCLASKGQPLFPLHPFLLWYEDDMKLLDRIEQGVPKYLSWKATDWNPPDLKSELLAKVDFLFKSVRQEPVPDVPLSANLARFRKYAMQAAEDGVVTEAEYAKLRVQQEALEISDAQASLILAEVLAAVPPRPAVIPSVAQVRFRSPATQTAHEGEVCFELLCDGFSHVRLRAENNLIAKVEASPVTVIKRVFKRTGQWRTLIAEGLDASDNILATETIEILPRDPLLSDFIKQMEASSAKVAYALTDAVARLKLVANVKSSAGMRFPDPANKESLFTLFALSNDGRVYTSGLEKIKDTGYPPELVETYQRTLNTLAGMNIESSGFGRGGVELSKVEPWVDAFVVAVSTLVAGLVAAAKTDIAAPSIKMVAQALGMKGRQLEQELTTIATRALLEDWSAVRMAIGATEQPTVHWAPMVTTLNEGRVGVNIGGGDRSWKPGLFAGVLFNPADHHTRFSRPDLGADFVVLVSVTRWDKAFDADKFMDTPEFSALRKRLSQDAGGWSFCDQLSLEKPNRWHPIHLRRPLVEVFAGCASPEKRYEAWMKAAKDGLSVILQGGELQSLRERYFSSEGALGKPKQPAESLTWPEAGQKLLLHLRDHLPSKLHYSPSNISSIEDIQTVDNNTGALNFFVDAQHFISIWFTAKYGKKIKIAVGFYAINDIKGPAYREARQKIAEAEPNFGEGWTTLADSNWKGLGYEAFYAANIHELTTEGVVQNVSSAVILLSSYIAKHFGGTRSSKANQ